MLRPRTLAAIAAARQAGIHVIFVTGRMFRSIRPYAAAASLDDPVVCYQGAAIVEPASGRFLLHQPIPAELAREAIAAVEAEGYGLNCYVDDDLYVERLTPEAESYASFQHIPLNPVGPLLDWLAKPPTKLVAIGPEDEMDALEARMKAHFGDRLYISKSLPTFLEFASPAVSKGSGMQFVADRLGFSREQAVGFGEGENDVELLEWASYGVAVANSHPRLLAVADWICPPAAEEGPAQVVEALLARRR